MNQEYRVIYKTAGATFFPVHVDFTEFQKKANLIIKESGLADVVKGKTLFYELIIGYYVEG